MSAVAALVLVIGLFFDQNGEQAVETSGTQTETGKTLSSQSAFPLGWMATSIGATSISLWWAAAAPARRDFSANPAL